MEMEVHMQNFNDLESNFDSRSANVDFLADVPPEGLDESLRIRELSKRDADANKLYSLCFQLLRVGHLEAEIPRLVVFGQQSMGKTTLLDFIMGGPIGYSSTDLGTKQPVVIMLQPSSKNQIECAVDHKAVSIQDLSNKIAEHMQSAGNEISAKELQVEIGIPGGVHAVFVDLPGIKDDSKAGASLTRSVVRNYVQSNPNDLYILVKKASDDPANWPWSLREFILSEKPKGLGLDPKQTIVVGTRAKDFLISEKNDVRTIDMLQERVQKRSLKDRSGTAFQLFLLELFSLTLKEKESHDFGLKKKSMEKQITDGHMFMKDALQRLFEPSKAQHVLRDLEMVFSATNFRNELNTKFKNLLGDQLWILERRLKQKRVEVINLQKRLHQEIDDHSPNKCRELIKLFLREYMAMVTDIASGNFDIMRLPYSGHQFLNKHGGNLIENLTEGHDMARELFSKSRQYESDFLSKLMEADTKMFLNNEEMPLQAGKAVRFLVSRDDSNMFGIFGDQLNARNESSRESTTSESSVVVSFLYSNTSSENGKVEEQVQSRSVALTRVKPLIPLHLAQLKSLAKKRCWLRELRRDSWVGLSPIEIVSGHLEESDGSAQSILVQRIEGTLLSGPISSEFTPFLTNSSDVYYEECNNAETLMQHIAGEYAECKLLNQLSFTHLGRWLKFHVGHLEPDIKFTSQVLLQMMRSVRNVADKADWEPLVADMLQANVSGGLLHLIRLSACSAAAALRRILKAAYFQLIASIENSDVSRGLMFLANNVRFSSRIHDVIEEYCRKKAVCCSREMKSFIFEQTHVLNSDLIKEFFDGCLQFENEFLEGDALTGVTNKLEQMLSTQRSKMNPSEYAPSNANGASQQIYKEVRLQFWAIKMLLPTPLVNKLYMHFVKDIVNSGAYLATENGSAFRSESAFEVLLQDRLLCLETDTGEAVPRPDEDLMSHFELMADLEKLLQKNKKADRVLRYIDCVLEVVSLLRTTSLKKDGVDFLMKLGV